VAGWFDRVARSTAERADARDPGSAALTSRRHFLRNAAMAAGGAAAAVVVGTQPAMAFTPCPAGKHRCGTRCIDLTCDPRHCGGCDDVCGANQVCNGGDCKGCQNGTRRCGTGCSATCSDFNTDSSNCGGCGNVCPAGSTCCGGVCCSGCCDTSGVCQPGNTVTNCGTGGNVCVICGGGQICFGSVCSAGA